MRSSVASAASLLALHLTTDNLRRGLDDAQGIVLRENALFDEVMNEAVEEQKLNAIGGLAVKSRRTAAISEIGGHMLLQLTGGSIVTLGRRRPIVLSAM